MMLSTWKMAPCLAYGNSAVHKPSEMSPLSIGVLCEIFEEAGMKILWGLQHGFGVRRRSRCPAPFTGSPATARDIATRAAAGLKRTSFELGGKSANIIFADADLSKGVPVHGHLYWTGMCGSDSVQREIYDRFLEQFEEGRRGLAAR